MKKSIPDFLDCEYREYTEIVTFKRAIPSLVDGFKPVRRKIFYYMKHNKNQMVKVSAIAGGIIERCNYHHGEASAQGAIIGMARNFPSSNNFPHLLSKGSFGSKILPKSAAAARYIFAKYNPLNDDIFLDNDLLLNNEELDSPEPKFYLPIIPMFAVNGVSGIGFGFACNILPRKFIDVIESVKQALNNELISDVDPYFEKCQYIIKKLSSSSFLITGQYKITDKKVTITEYIPGSDREKIIENLISLQDSEVIKSYKDESKTEYKILVEFNKNHSEDKIVSYLNLAKQFHENFTLLDENNKIINFESYETMIKYFVNHRLSYYTKRKALEVVNLKRDNERLEAIKLFIKHIDSITKLDEKQIKEFFKDQIKPEFIEYCLKQPLHWFLKKNIKDCDNSIASNNEQITYFETVKETKLYLNDIKALEKSLMKLNALKEGF